MSGLSLSVAEVMLSGVVGAFIGLLGFFLLRPRPSPHDEARKGLELAAQAYERAAALEHREADEAVTVVEERIAAIEGAAKGPDGLDELAALGNRRRG